MAIELNKIGRRHLITTGMNGERLSFQNNNQEAQTSLKMAEREGFEPSIACAIPLFESGQFNHSCTSPYRLLFYHT